MKFYGELLLSFLLFITNARILFIRHAERDPMVVLAPFSFCVCILQILAWGLDIFSIYSLLLAILVCFSNFHAIARYSQRLYIDHYSPLMKLWAFLTMLLGAAGIAGCIIFAPVELRNDKLGISETVSKYSGSFRSSFSQTDGLELVSLIYHEFSPENAPAPQEIILFIPDKRGDTQYYRPFLQFLAQEGQTVVSADFFADDCRWLHSVEDIKILRRLAMVVRSLINQQKFESQREYYSFNIAQELEALLKIGTEKYGDGAHFFVVTDFMGDIAAGDFIKKYPAQVKGIFSLTGLPENVTPGYGCVRQTDPLLAMLLNQTRDKTCAEPRQLAKTVSDFVLAIKYAEFGGN